MEVGGACEDDAEGEGNQGQVGGRRVLNFEEEAVGHDGEEGREALDGVHERDGDARSGVGAQDVAANLEAGEGQGDHDQLFGRWADAVLEKGHCVLDARVLASEGGEDETPARDEGELDRGQGDGAGQGGQDGLGGHVGEYGRHVPHAAEHLEPLVSTRPRIRMGIGGGGGGVQ